MPMDLGYLENRVNDDGFVEVVNSFFRNQQVYANYFNSNCV
jgi:hypothetical protein